MANKDVFTFYNGVTIPSIGFGTWQIPNNLRSGDDGFEEWLRTSIRRMLITMRKMSGKAIRDFGIAREEVFVTSKLPAQVKDFDGALQHFEETMNNLGLDYFESLLNPCAMAMG